MSCVVFTHTHTHTHTHTRTTGTIRRATQFRYSMDVLDSVLAKYLATALGWLLLARVAKVRQSR